MKYGGRHAGDEARHGDVNRKRGSGLVLIHGDEGRPRMMVKQNRT